MSNKLAFILAKCIHVKAINFIYVIYICGPDHHAWSFLFASMQKFSLIITYSLIGML